MSRARTAHRTTSLLPALAAALLLPASSPAEDLYLTGATLHPVSGPAVPGGVLRISGDTIVEAGAGLAVPPGARTVDLAGKHLYPAFVHAASVLGLTEISAVGATVDTAESGDFHPELRAEVAFHADSRLLPPAMAAGVVFAHVVPRGGVLSGTSAVMRLEGWHWPQMTVRAPAGLHLRFPRVLAEPGRPFGRPAKTQKEVDEEREKTVEALERLLDDARAYGRAPRQGSAEAVPRDPRLEALLPVLAGELPLFLHAEELQQMEAALDFAAAEDLDRVVLVGGADAAEIASRLAEEQVPVILTGVLTLPERRWQPYDRPFTAAARLHAAGVEVAIADAGVEFQASNARNLPYHAAMAAAFGLPAEAALEAITLVPARILGVDDRLGSLEAGKEASFLVTDGDPLEITTRVEAVWHAGEPLHLGDDRQRRLYERYRRRPAPQPGPPRSGP